MNDASFCTLPGGLWSDAAPVLSGRGGGGGWRVEGGVPVLCCHQTDGSS